MMQLQDFIGYANMVYMSHYTMPEKYMFPPLNYLLVVLAKQNQQDLAISLDCF